MNLDDRLRNELRERSAHIEATGAGPRQVIAGARARTRRARIVGGVAAGLFLVAVGGAALALRDSPGEGSITATATLPDDGRAVDGPTAEPDEADTASQDADSGAKSGEVATTDPDDRATSDDTADAGSPVADVDPPDDDPPAAPAEEPDDAATPPAARSAAREIINHRQGFVALQGDGASVAFTTDGRAWTDIADPRPTRRSSITQIASHDGVLYVAGDRPGNGSSRPWVASSTDLQTWTEIDVPVPPGDTSDLTHTFTRLYRLAAGPAGILATGETIIDLRIEALVDAAVLESGSWSLGDSTGDLSKVIVYDAGGDVTEEIDLIAAGVPRATIQRWSAGEPIGYVAIAPLGGSFTIADAQLDSGTVLVDGIVTPDGFVSAGFSDRFSSRIVWTSTDGTTWQSEPVGVVANEQADEIGLVGGRITTFASQGPILTVQQQRGGTWRESRLDALFGNPNDDYLLMDAAFHTSGVAAVVATVGQSESTTLWLARSDDARSWTVTPLGEALGVTGAISRVNSIALDADQVAVSFTGGGTSRFVIVDR